MEPGTGPPFPKPMNTRDRVRALALEILRMHPAGMAYGELVRQVLDADTSLNPSTVSGYIATAEQTFPGAVYRPSRGVFRLTAFRDTEAAPLQVDVLTEPPAEIEIAPAEPLAELASTVRVIESFADREVAEPVAATKDEYADREVAVPAQADADSPGVGLRHMAEEYAASGLLAVIAFIVALLIAMRAGYAVWVGP